MPVFNCENDQKRGADFVTIFKNWENGLIFVDIKLLMRYYINVS